MGGFNLEVPSFFECKKEMESAPARIWDEKRPSAYWRGFKLGKLKDQNGLPTGRLRLFIVSTLNGTMSSLRAPSPDEDVTRLHEELAPAPLDAMFSNRSRLAYSDVHPMSSYQENYPEFPFNNECGDIHKMKYAISIDGYYSSWTWFALILASDAVPILIESDFFGLYSEALIPFVHYVPVK